MRIEDRPGDRRLIVCPFAATALALFALLMAAPTADVLSRRKQ